MKLQSRNLSAPKSTREELAQTPLPHGRGSANLDALCKAMRWLATAVVAFVFVLSAPALYADAIDDEYLQRKRALQSDDLDAHYQLGLWCKEKERWQLAADQARHILRIRPDHGPAKLLLQLAQAQLGHLPSNAETTPGATVPSGSAPAVRELTVQEIQRIRLLELYTDRPERGPIDVSRDAITEFWAMSEKERWLNMDQATYYRLPKIEQVQLMLRYAPDQFRDKIVLRFDPERMQTFIRRVQPVVLRGCATADCHGGPSGGGFRLIDGRGISEGVAYANFFLMQVYQKDGFRIINRDQPRKSLLLSYGLPKAGGPDAQAYHHPGDIDPIFSDERDRDFQLVRDWLESLAIDRPDYGISLNGTP